MLLPGYVSEFSVPYPGKRFSPGFLPQFLLRFLQKFLMIFLRKMFFPRLFSRISICLVVCRVSCSDPSKICEIFPEFFTESLPCIVLKFWGVSFQISLTFAPRFPAGIFQKMVSEYLLKNLRNLVEISRGNPERTIVDIPLGAPVNKCEKKYNISEKSRDEM